MGKAYKKTEPHANGAWQAMGTGAGAMISDRLEQVVCDGAERLLAEILELEVDEFLLRLRYRRHEMSRGRRNGHAPARTIGVGLGQVTCERRGSAMCQRR